MLRPAAFFGPVRPGRPALRRSASAARERPPAPEPPSGPRRPPCWLPEPGPGVAGPDFRVDDPRAASGLASPRDSRSRRGIPPRSPRGDRSSREPPAPPVRPRSAPRPPARSARAARGARGSPARPPRPSDRPGAPRPRSPPARCPDSGGSPSPGLRPDRRASCSRAARRAHPPSMSRSSAFLGRSAALTRPPRRAVGGRRGPSRGRASSSCPGAAPCPSGRRWWRYRRTRRTCAPRSPARAAAPRPAPPGRA